MPTFTPFDTCTPFVPHPHAAIEHGALPSAVPESAYKQWCTRYNALCEKDIHAHRIIYPSNDLLISGMMVTPQTIPDEGLPLLIFNRGGTGKYGMLTVLQILYLLAPLASMGYIVLASNYRGNDGSEGTEEFGGGDVHDVLNLLALGKQLPTWDGRNTYLAGWSRGGLMTLMADKLGANTNAIATIAGITDCISTMHDHADMRALYEKRIPFSSEEEFMDALKARSAVCWPERITAPLLIQHGDADERIRVDQAQRLTALLETRNHPHKTIYYAGGNHFLNAQRPDLLREIDLWFQAYRK